MRRAAFLVCAFAVGCSAEIETVGGAGPTPTPAPTGRERPLVPDPTPDVPPPPANEGYVSIHTSEHPRGAGQVSDFYVSANAWFGPIEESRRTPISGCEYKQSVPFSSASASSEEPKSDDAGLVVIDVTLGPEKNVLKLPFDSTEGRYERHWNGADGHANGLVHVRAAGGAVPPFDVSISALSPIHVVSPAQGSKVGPRDFTVSWTSGNADTASLVYVSNTAGTVYCSVGKGEKQVVVPESLMATLLSDGNEEEVQLMVWTGRRTQVDAGDYRIGVSDNTSTYLMLVRE